MSDAQTAQPDLNKQAKPLIDKLPDELNWQQDNRFNALMAEVPKPLFEIILPWLEAEFEHKWDRDNIKKAPDLVKLGAGMFAKMEKDQFLFSGIDIDEKLMLAWWPWGPGAPASLRIFIAQDPEDIKQPGVFSKIKSLIFG
ncbi:hypothetical protein DS2_06451 [Catenovulum agarivorans DS-2]|uniref:Uncharacterized protein n=1 Tax=Catenovulum agarivorans DS-2 TaxID=1328313 RepID=W7QZY1_9ALTE|nr:hypothetical protein [Catenovulum agarivorans]EWH10910.1 hypothetical protein DS2_06451 [Catenovulum agarivorans DS-2]